MPLVTGQKRTPEVRAAAERAQLLAALTAVAPNESRPSRLREATDYLQAHPYDLPVLDALMRYLDRFAPTQEER